MLLALNKFVGVGQIRRGPRYRKNDGGSRVCDVSLEIAGSGKSRTFVDVTFWNDAADRANQLAAGETVLICGRIASESYTRDGAKVFKVKLVADFLEVLPDAPTEKKASKSTAATKKVAAPAAAKPVAAPSKPAA